jgi:DNA-binding NtrC family response regulator
VLRIQDPLEQQGSSQANTHQPSPAETEQTIDALRHILVGRTLADVERHLILDTLASCFGNRTHAARILGISIRTLRNKLNEYMGAGFAVPEPGQRPTVAA